MKKTNHTLKHIIMKRQELKMVIDADNNKCIERFEESKAQEIKAKYEAMGKWADVGLDVNNDLILWEE